MAQLKNQNSHKMAPRGEEDNGAILEHKTSCAIYVACVKDPIEKKNRPKIAHFGWPTYFKMKRYMAQLPLQ